MADGYTPAYTPGVSGGGSQTGLTITVNGVEIDIFVAQRIIARLLRGMQKIALLRTSRAFGRWKSWDQYEIIKAKTDVMVATKQLEFFVSSSLQEVRDMVGCDRATFFMVNMETHDLWSAKADGHSVSFRVPKGSGVAGNTVEEKTPSNVHDAYRDPRFNSSFDKLSGYHTNTILCYPVFAFEESKLKEGKEETSGSTTVIACVQLVNKHSGVFTRGDEDTCEMLCTFLARAMSMEDNSVNFSAVRTEFDAWSIIQRKQLMTDRAYGNTIQDFLEQVCLLSGSSGTRFILKQRQRNGTTSQKRGLLQQWQGTCQHSATVSDKTVTQSVNRAWKGKESFLLHDHIDGFKHTTTNKKSAVRGGDLNCVILIPLFLIEEDQHKLHTLTKQKSGSALARMKSAAKRTAVTSSASERCVCILEFERRLPDMDDINAYVKYTTATVTNLFHKFGKSLFDSTLSNDEDGAGIAKLADIRGWVRMEMHKQVHLKFEKTTLRTNKTLTKTVETLKQQNVELKKQVTRAERLCETSEKDRKKYKSEKENMEMQRDMMADQMVAMTPDTPQVAASQLEKQAKKFRIQLLRCEKEIQDLKHTHFEQTKQSNLVTSALEAAVTSIADLEEQKKNSTRS